MNRTGGISSPYAMIVGAFLNVNAAVAYVNIVLGILSLLVAGASGRSRATAG